MSKKILLLGSQHGNELLGAHLYNHIKRNRPALLRHIHYTVGNPRAYKQQTRYIESDLNRSYTGKRTTYEERRAERILRFIRQEAFDLVLDLHTTTCVQAPCLIISGLTSKTQEYLRASSIENIVYMNHPIVRSSLIGVCPQAISIELQASSLSDSVLSCLADDLERYVHTEIGLQPKRLYEVRDLLDKREITRQDAAALRNFTYSNLGFYPILVGENSYKKYTNYLGFKAYTVKTIKV